MNQRKLGRTGLLVPEISFGCGPVSGLLTGSDFALQLATVKRALDAGIDWFDTAAGYGNGSSEANLGRVLKELGATPRIATKVRILDDGFDRIKECVRESVHASLVRLGVESVELLQLHNGITRSRGDEPASVSPADASAALAVFKKLQSEGIVRHIGLTGTGRPEALREVVRTGGFDTLQVPYNILNPSAGGGPVPPGETDYGNIIADCAKQNMGVFAIRVLAGGALLGQPPSAHTLKTSYFPLALYERDSHRAKEMGGSAGAAVRFVLDHPQITSAIVGYGTPNQVDTSLSLPRAVD